jgi:hypothetical protein
MENAGLVGVGLDYAPEWLHDSLWFGKRLQPLQDRPGWDLA